MSINKELIKLIRKERIKQGLTVKQLAVRAGVSERAIRFWESGDRQLTIENANKVLKALGITFTIGNVG